MSASERPELASIRIDCSLPVALSLAVTLSTPLLSTSKVTSTCGTPRGAGGMPSRLNSPRTLLSLNIGRSPCATRIMVDVWLSEAVENTWDFLVGMWVFFSINFVFTPPMVSIPSESGITSTSVMSFTSPWKIPAWIAAPRATTSSGLMVRFGSLPKSAFTAF